MTKAFLTLLLVAHVAGAGCSKVLLPYDFLTIPAGSRAALAGNFSEVATKSNNCMDSVDQVRGRFENFTGSLLLKSQENLRLQIDANSSTPSGKFIVENGTGDSVFVVNEDSTWRFFGLGRVQKVYASDSIIGTIVRATVVTSDTGRHSRVMANRIYTGPTSATAFGSTIPFLSYTGPNIMSLNQGTIIQSGGTGINQWFDSTRFSAGVSGLRANFSSWVKADSLHARVSRVDSSYATKGFVSGNLDVGDTIIVDGNHTASWNGGDLVIGAADGKRIQLGSETNAGAVNIKSSQLEMDGVQGFTGSCTNTEFVGGVAVGCND